MYSSPPCSITFLCVLLSLTIPIPLSYAALPRNAQSVLKAGAGSVSNGGHNEPYFPSIDRPIPGKVPFEIDETTHSFAKYVNGSDNGYYRRSSCPAVNILANRGYINRSGRNITYEEIAQASRDVWNFGDDNVGRNPPFLGIFRANAFVLDVQALLTLARSFWLLHLPLRPIRGQHTWTWTCLP